LSLFYWTLSDWYSTFQVFHDWRGNYVDCRSAFLDRNLHLESARRALAAAAALSELSPE